MEKSLNEIYELVSQGELKKEDLIEVENLFDSEWEKRYFADEDASEMIEHYESNYDCSYDYGLCGDIFVTIYNLNCVEDCVKLEFFGSWLDCMGDRTIKITDETKNELKKMGIPKNKKLEEWELRTAAFQAAKKIIISQELGILRDEAKE